MIVFDTETTGLPGPVSLPLEKQPKIIEYCFIKLDDATRKEVGRMSGLLDPKQPLEEIIKKITNISDSDLKGQPTFSEKFEEINSFFEGERYWIAHNLAFDKSLMEFELKRIGKLEEFNMPKVNICTVQSTYHIKGRRMRMSEMYEYLTDGGSFKDAHRAEADTAALAHCVRELIERGEIILR
jgi:DNA polymerase III epsilon subunit-like protein